MFGLAFGGGARRRRLDHDLLALANMFERQRRLVVLLAEHDLRGPSFEQKERALDPASRAEDEMLELPLDLRHAFL